jgi:hypothetical protein
MKRTTISIPEDLLARAQRVADQRGVSLGEVLREATRAYVDGGLAWDPPRSLGCVSRDDIPSGRDLVDLPEEAYGRGPRP